MEPSQSEEVLAPSVLAERREVIEPEPEPEPEVVRPSSTEGFGNMKINVDLILKSVFWATIFYLLCLPDVHKLTAKFIGKKVDANLVHALVYAVLYFVVTPLI